MKKLITIISIMLVIATNIIAQDQQSGLWKKDLDYLVERIEIMHPNPYSFITKEDFYQLKKGLYDKIPNLSDAEIVLSISELLATLNDGHTQWALDKTDPMWLQQNFHLLPLIQYNFKDGIHIMAALQPYENLVGLKVIQIGNMPIREVTSKLSALMSHDNSAGERKYLYYSLCMAEMLKMIGAVDNIDEIEMILQDDVNNVSTVQIPTVDLFSMVPFLASSWYPQSGNGLIAMNQVTENPLPLWLKNSGEKFWFEYMPEDKTMYLQINSLNLPHGSDEELSPFGILCGQLFESFDKNGAEKLVIDIRTNTGGNHVELPLLEGIMARPELNKADRLFLITGRVTFSAAVHLTTILKRYTNITHIGEPPSGRPNHYGANRTFSPPNHPEIKINCSIDYYQDSTPFNFNVMQSPKIYAEITADNYRNNIDPAMQIVKNYDRIINQVDEIKDKLEQAHSSSGLYGMKKTYNLNEEAILESGYNLERLFKDFYYNFLTENKNNGTNLTDFLMFAVEQCPESIDLNYLLALQLESYGRLEETKQKYNRCLELNPEHHYARMKLGLLELQ